MRKLIFILILTMLLCGSVEGATKIGLDRLNWSQSLPVGANVTLNEGYLVDAKLGGSSPEVTVGAYKWCDFVTDGINDEVQWNLAIATGKRVHLVGNHVLEANVTIPGPSFYISGDGPRKTVVTLKGNTKIILGRSDAQWMHGAFENLEIKRNLNGASKTGTIGVDVQYGALFWGDLKHISNCYIHGSELNLLVGKVDESMGAGDMVVEKCTLGSDPSDWATDRAIAQDAVGAQVNYGLNVHFDHVFFGGYSFAGLALGNNIRNHVQLRDCYANNATGQYGYYVANGMIIMEGCGAEAATISDLYIAGGTDHKVSNCFFGGAGNSSTVGRGITVEAVIGYVDGVKLSNVDVAYTNGAYGDYWHQASVYITAAAYTVRNVQITNSNIYDCGTEGILVANTNDVTLTSNNIEWAGVPYGVTANSAGIEIYEDRIGAKNNHVIMGNVIGTNRDGILISGHAANLTIIGNVVETTTLGGAAVYDGSDQAAYNVKEYNIYHA